MERPLYWIWLSLRLGAGRAGVVALLERFGTPEDIYHADVHELGEVIEPKNRALITRLCDKKLDEAYQIETYCAKNRISVLCYGQPGYPKQLMNLKNPPVLLYAKGNIKDLDTRVSVAVVGTRTLSEYGRQSAYKIGYELASAGAVVVSGLALGIDSVAACGALDARGRTVAVLGGGLDHIYPSAHKRLAAEIARHGLLLSEYPPLASPTRGAFPTRNRIISGLCQATLVVEASERSGALITADEAILQGRELYAIPGNIDEDNTRGTNDLIKAGARAVTCAADILENYKYLYGMTLDLSRLDKLGKRSQLRRGVLKAHGVAEGEEQPMQVKSTTSPRGELSQLLRKTGRVDGETIKAVSGETEYPVYRDDMRAESKAPPKAASGVVPEDLEEPLRRVLCALPVGQVVGVDMICAGGLETASVMTSLTMLEIRGLVRSLPGNCYIRD